VLRHPLGQERITISKRVLVSHGRGWARVSLSRHQLGNRATSNSSECPRRVPQVMERLPAINTRIDLGR
jgi:hypothetical protein